LARGRTQQESFVQIFQDLPRICANHRSRTDRRQPGRWLGHFCRHHPNGWRREFLPELRSGYCDHL